MSEHCLFLDESYPAVLADIAITVHEQLMEDPRIKLPHTIAAEVALKVAEHVRKNLGGVATYIPLGMNFELSHRDRQIWNEFTGDNYDALALKWNLTSMRVRQIITRAAKADRASRQTNLFPEPDL